MCGLGGDRVTWFLPLGQGTGYELNAVDVRLVCILMYIIYLLWEVCSLPLSGKVPFVKVNNSMIVRDSMSLGGKGMSNVLSKKVKASGQTLRLWKRTLKTLVQEYIISQLCKI